MTEGSIRASDNDRETVVSALREAFTEGRLTLDEFDERTSAAYAAKTWGDLSELTDDLPSPPVFGGQRQEGQRLEGQRHQPETGAPNGAEPGQLPSPAIPPLSRVSPDLMRTMPRRPHPLGRLLPVVFIWAVIAAAAGAAHLAAVLAVVFVAALAVRALSGNRRW
jgi:hypothetical protein